MLRYVLKLTDFQSTETVVTFHNLTSHAPPVEAARVSLAEIQADALVLGVPTTSCNLNHNVMLEVSRRDPGAPALNFQATGKVTEVEKTEDPAEIRVRIQLVQYDEETWQMFLARSEDRQAAITQFLNQARG